MKRAILPLLLLLLLQLAALLILSTESGHWDLGPASPPLASFSAEKITEIRIDDESDNQAVLLRSVSGWSLPRLGHAPADGDRVNRLLEVLGNSDHGWPVADTAAARQRLQVADYRYQRQLTLYAQGLVAEKIYLGSAPAFKRVHARNAGQNAIYSIPFSAFEAPANDNAWLDRRLLQVRSPLAIVADAYSLHWRDGKWLSGIGATPDERELQALLSTLRTLQVGGVADGETHRDLHAAEAELALNIEALAGNMTLELFRLKGRHYVHSSEYRLFFELGASQFERLTGIDIALISGKAEAANRTPR